MKQKVSKSIRVNPTTWRIFREKCVEKGRTMEYMIEELLSKWGRKP